VHPTSSPASARRGRIPAVRVPDLSLEFRPGPAHDVHVLLVGLDHGLDRATIAAHTAGLGEHLAATARSVTVRPVPGASGRAARAGGHLAGFTTTLAARLPHVPGLVVAVVPGLAGAVAAARIADRHRVPLVLVVHDLVSARPAGRYGCRRLRVAEAAERRLLPRAAQVAVTTPDLDPVVCALGVPAGRVHLLPPWTAHPAGDVDRLAARRALGWPARPFTVVAPLAGDGRPDPATVVAAIRLLDGAVDLVLLGEGARRVAAEARDAGLTRVRVAAPADHAERRRMLGAADLLVLAQRPEATGPGVPQALVDCLGAGRAVLAAAPGDSGVPAELDRAGGAGLVVRPGDPVALAAAVRALQLDEDLRRAMGAAGLHHARDRFDRARALQRLDGIVAAALTGS